MQNSAHAIWYIKYRPKTIDNYVFHNPQHKAKVLEMIKNKTIPDLLFAGVQGSGKTTLARILINELEIDEMDFLTINASDERGIDTFREDIKSFATTMPMGAFKVIHLEEADRLTPQAQDALKAYMEDMSEYVRFILTCNRVHMISGPLRSRCQEFILKPSDKDEVLEYLVTVLASEKVKFQLDTLEQYTELSYPDVRKIVNNLQQNTIGGVLSSPTVGTKATSEYKPKMLELIDKGDWTGARELACASIPSEDWEDFYRFLYDQLSSTKKFSSGGPWEEGIILIAEHLYRHTLCADPEINAAALLIKLGQI